MMSPRPRSQRRRRLNVEHAATSSIWMYLYTLGLELVENAPIMGNCTRRGKHKITKNVKWWKPHLQKGQRVAVTGVHTAQLSVTDANIFLSQEGTIIDVDADGSYGYHVVLMILVLKGHLPLGLSITDFQKSLWEYS